MKFVNPSNLIAYTGVLQGSTVADFGCGGGFYTVAAAKCVGGSGCVYAVDILEDKLSATISAAKNEGLKNVMVQKSDLEKPLTAIQEGSCDLVILASILHEIGAIDPLVKNAYRLLKTGGKILAVEWKKELTPFGPAIERRIAQEDLERMFNQIGMRKEKDIPADSYHYAMLFVK